MYGQARYADTNSLLNAKIDRFRPLIVAHRGTASGMVVENTAKSIAAALKMGAEMVEIDVVSSTDGDFFLFHDTKEPRHFGTTQNINTMSTAEIRALKYIWYSHPTNPVRVEELSAVLDRFRGDTLFSVDRSWWYWPQLFGFLDGYDMAQQLCVKCPVSDENLAVLASHAVKYPFAPMVRTTDEVERVLAEPEINTVGVELLTDTPDSVFLDPAYVAELHSRGLFCLANAINLTDPTPLFAKLDDETSLFKDEDDGWGGLMRLGVDMIQTDWPSLLLAYRERG